jgi:hypothetical protein
MLEINKSFWITTRKANVDNKLNKINSLGLFFKNYDQRKYSIKRNWYNFHHKIYRVYIEEIKKIREEIKKDQKQNPKKIRIRLI